MKKIRLNNNKYALVDDEDYKYISQFSWKCYKNGYRYYAYRYDKKNVYMHRDILKTSSPEIDHINRNGLDNRRLNLRGVDRSQNLSNRMVWGTSKAKGVSYHTRDKVWQVHKRVDGKQIYLGSYNTEQEAIGRQV